ncbi:alpha/beta hydrolase-fold protein [Aliikangiella maris]|uniref:Alpha/beta hydrolase-fold protein n=2 Tax=Aliikangiella maris TaxID=3162458 RepID=A0ABV2BT11_9GAMM
MQLVLLIMVAIVMLNGCLISDNRHFNTADVQMQPTFSIVNYAINENISLNIYLPSSLTAETNRTTDKHYPVLYVMDGQHYMFHAIGYQHALTQGISKVNISPEFIVVGINTRQLAIKDRRSEYLFSNAAAMTDLLTQQIIPYVEQNFPVNLRRLYFGWQFAAGFGMHLFTVNPNLFDAYFLASANTLTPDILENTRQTFEKLNHSNHAFYLSLGKMETHAITSHQKLVALFEHFADKGVKWKYQYFDRFSPRYDHHTTPLESLTHGLEWFFSDHPDLTFYSLADVRQFGGVEAVIAYYRKRAERYQVSPQLSEQTLFSLFRHAAQENDWIEFQYFEKRVGEYQVNAWFELFGEFFIQNKIYHRAEKVYITALENEPDNIEYWSALAKVYELQQSFTKAKAAYRQALYITQLQIAQAQSNQDQDADVQFFLDKIEKLKVKH